MSWLSVTRGEAPLIVSLPHTGTDIPDGFGNGLVSPWLSRKDADWWIERLYGFAEMIGATVIRTAISRTVIDVNRDPSGKSLYPGQATTDLCPITTFDGEQLYKPGLDPSADDIALRRSTFFDPYHDAIATEIARLRTRHQRVVLYDCHSIRSVIPRLFEGTLPHINFGTNSGASCDAMLEREIGQLFSESGFSYVANGHFKGGYITRHYGQPPNGVHALQVELACRGYMHEPDRVDSGNWPAPYDDGVAAPMRLLLIKALESCLNFANR